MRLPSQYSLARSCAVHVFALAWRAMGARTWARGLVAAGPVVLFAAFPVVSLFAHNQSEIELGVLWWPLVVAVGGALALYGVFLLALKDAPKAGALASLAVVAFFYYGIFLSAVGLGKWLFFALWLALLVVGVVLVLRARSDLATLTLIVGVGAAVLVVLPVARIAIYQVRHSPISAADPRLWPTELPKPDPASRA